MRFPTANETLRMRKNLLLKCSSADQQGFIIMTFFSYGSSSLQNSSLRADKLSSHFGLRAVKDLRASWTWEVLNCLSSAHTISLEDIQ